MKVSALVLNAALLLPMFGSTSVVMRKEQKEKEYRPEDSKVRAVFRFDGEIGISPQQSKDAPKTMYVPFPVPGLQQSLLETHGEYGHVEKFLASRQRTNDVWRLEVRAPCNIIYESNGEEISGSTECTIHAPPEIIDDATCGCTEDIAADTYACNGRAPTTIGDYFLDDCVPGLTASPKLLEVGGTVIQAGIDAKAGFDTQTLAVQQIAEVAKQSGPNTVLLVTKDIRSRVISLLGDESAKEKVIGNVVRIQGSIR